MNKKLLNLAKVTYSGQTMVEALVALAAAVIIISSITVAVITSSSNTSYSTNQNKATQLAREGLDIVRKFRDQNTADFGDTSGMYCYGDELVLSRLVNKPSDCTPEVRVDDIYIRTVNFIQADDPKNTCDEATQVDAMVSWSDGKCPSGNQFCKNVKLVSCMSTTTSMLPLSGGGQPGGNTNLPPYSAEPGVPDTTTTYGYIQAKVTCPSPRTPDQVCATNGWDKADTRTSIIARGYWWRQSGGAAIEACSGLQCTVSRTDGAPQYGAYWTMQNPMSNGQPYPASYILAGTATTLYNPLAFEGLSCSSYAPGWTLRVSCQRTTTGSGEPEDSPPSVLPGIQITTPLDRAAYRLNSRIQVRYIVTNSNSLSQVAITAVSRVGRQISICSRTVATGVCEWNTGMMTNVRPGIYTIRAVARMESRQSVTDEVEVMLR